jgi:hypothetical protein
MVMLVVYPVSVPFVIVLIIEPENLSDVCRFAEKAHIAL